MANQKLRIIYRSNFHAPRWLVADKSGCWNKDGLDVDTSPQLVRELDDSGYIDQLYQSTAPIRGLAVNAKQI